MLRTFPKASTHASSSSIFIDSLSVAVDGMNPSLSDVEWRHQALLSEEAEGNE